jgi:hypothetical protein
LKGTAGGHTWESLAYVIPAKAGIHYEDEAVEARGQWRAP